MKEQYRSLGNKQKQTNAFIWVAIVVVMLGVGLFVGLKLLKSIATPLTSTNTTTPGDGTPPGGAGSGSSQAPGGEDLSDNVTMGAITTISSTSVTIQPKSGDVHTYSITSSTKKMTPSGITAFSTSGVKAGDTVGVYSTDDSTAERIIFNSGSATQSN